jgi:cellulose synthase (UDP-forming)
MSVTETERLEARRSGERGMHRVFPAGDDGRMSRGSRILDVAMGLAGVALVLAVATVPLQPAEQAIFAVISAIVFMIANRFSGRGVTMFLVVLSLAVSLRYIFWRMTETLDYGSPLELVLGSGLVLAEIYAITVLVLGYVQTVWPLNRKPMPLPDDPDTWPTVDVYIPTYNEPMSVVRATVLAALAMDWPRDKMRVWVLDDGRREEFRLFAEACGCGYITRKNNLHAKAGNLNNAMTQTDGEYIAIFDCDHIPTRAFLQMTMGWLVVDPNIALVQTPHHFYSPDPFQRNLTAGTRVPAEGNMFYGLVQDGNDYWNACFFCGSCAVLRRTALEEIGGIAVETVTEDAHTMLKLHRRGWDSAYLKLPLAAGLATERLALHIGQRIRWARGMIQILRIDNPLFGRGLTVGQRICYLQAMGHFLFAIPRVVFLTSPLAYLLLGQNIISASPLAITAYAIPHIFHSVATNSRVQQQWRHSFWSEIYETVLALFLVRVTLVTLVSPRRGKFNVTAKGGLLENGFFDLSAVYPNLVLAFLLVAGVIRGFVGLFLVEKGQTLTFQALLLNSIWATLSLLIVLAALAVGRETRQIRSRARINANLPISIYLPDGRVVTGASRDLSQGGGSFLADRPAHFVDGTDVDIEFPLGDEPIMVPARILRWDENAMQARWQPETIEEEARVVQAVFGRADAWTDWAAYPKDRPIASLLRVLVSIRGLFRPRDKSPTRPTGQPPAAGGQPVSGPQSGTLPATGARQLAGTAAVALAFVLLSAEPGLAQTRSQTTVRPIPQLVTPLQPPAPPTFQSTSPGGATPVGAIVPPAGPSEPAPGVPPPPPAGVLAPARAPVSGVPDLANRPGARRVVYNLHQLGAQGPLAMRGTSELQGVEFGVRADEVVTGAQLSLSGAMGPQLIPEFSNVTVTLNEQYVGTIPVNRDQPAFNLDMPVSPVFFQDNNRLNFRFTGRYTPECNDPLSGLLWATVYDTSTLTLTLERLPPQRDLSRLPLPFFDPHEKLMLTLPFVLSATPSNESLKAAGIAASWFGQLAAFRGASFPVTAEPPAEGNAVMVVIGGEGRASGFLPPINGPTLAVVANPNDQFSSILVIGGRNGDEAVTAAAALSLGSRALNTDVSVVQPPDVPARAPYDAPNWIPTNRPVKLGEMVDSAGLQSFGYVGLVHVPFRTAPDFYTWRNRPFPANIRFRSPPGPIIDVAPSRLDVGINGIYLDTFSLAPSERRDSWFSRLLDFGVSQPDARVDVPAYDIFGNNDLQFYFDARPLHRGECVAIPSDLRMSVDPDSTIDLSRGYRFASMPNLAYFVNSGFPFTRMADLSETAVVVPDRPTSVETSAFLNLMGRLGSLTGFPVIRMAVTRPDGVNSYPDRDLLLIGTIPRMQGAAELLRNAPVRMSGNRLTTELPSTLDSVRRIFGDNTDNERQKLSTQISAGISETTAFMEGVESPLHSGRSVVAILAASPQGLERVVSTFRDTVQAPLIQGDNAILSGDHVTSYRVGDAYTVGTLPFWIWPSWALRDQPYGSVAVMLAGCLLVGFALYWALRRRGNARIKQEPGSR